LTKEEKILMEKVNTLEGDLQRQGYTPEQIHQEIEARMGGHLREAATERGILPAGERDDARLRELYEHGRPVGEALEHHGGGTNSSRSETGRDALEGRENRHPQGTEGDDHRQREDSPVTEQRTADDHRERSQEQSERPTVERPVIERPSVEMERPTVEMERPTVEIEQPSMEMERPTAEYEQPMNEQPAPEYEGAPHS